MFVRAEQSGDCLEQLLQLAVGDEELKRHVTIVRQDASWKDGWLM